MTDRPTPDPSRKREGRFGAVCSLALILTTLSNPIIAATPDYPYLVRTWQGHDARLLTIGTRLAIANAPLCKAVQPTIGLMLTDFIAYAKPEKARAVLGLMGDVAVEAVASGGAAEAAGLRAGDEVLAIDGGAASGGMPRLNTRIDTALSLRGTTTLRYRRLGQPPREVTIPGTPACRSRFSMLPSGKIAKADGLNIAISLPLFAEHSLDDEAAFMIAHELAHNILGHNQRANKERNNYQTIKRFEREADRLAPWLMANAGYDPAAAPRFMAHWGQRHDQGITRSPTHDGWRDRQAAITAELALITAARQQTALVDWRNHFPNQSGE